MKRHLLQFWRGFKFLSIAMVGAMIASAIGMGIWKGFNYVLDLIPHGAKVVGGWSLFSVFLIWFIYWLGGGEEWRRHEG